MARYPIRILTPFSHLQKALLDYLKTISSEKEQETTRHIRNAIEAYAPLHPGYDATGLKRYLAAYRQEILDEHEEDLEHFDKDLSIFLASLITTL